MSYLHYINSFKQSMIYSGLYHTIYMYSIIYAWYVKRYKTLNAALETCNESVENDEGKNLEYDIIGIIESNSVIMKIRFYCYLCIMFYLYHGSCPFHNKRITARICCGIFQLLSCEQYAFSV